MKKFLMFILGAVVGAVLCFLIVLIIGLSANKNGVTPNNGKIFSDTEVEYSHQEAFKVFQVLNSGDALAFEMKWEDRPYGGGSYSSTYVLVLLLKGEGPSYYDEQVIEVPSGKRAMQVGVYKYQNNGGMNKTIPMISIK